MSTFDNPNWEHELHKIMAKRAEIIDLFFKTFIAAQADTFIKNPELVLKVELVERKEGNDIIYFLRFNE
jgi:hypothetical protein